MFIIFLSIAKISLEEILNNKNIDEIPSIEPTAEPTAYPTSDSTIFPTSYQTVLEKNFEPETVDENLIGIAFAGLAGITITFTIIYYTYFK